MDINTFLFFVIAAIFGILVIRRINRSKGWKSPINEFPGNWRKVLVENVSFYAHLNNDEKKRFEYKIHEFILNIKIVGVDAAVDDRDKVLVAASAIIPIFEFPNWQYLNLKEVLLYPDRFDENFNTSNGKGSILGMVGTGYMEGKIILSKPALSHGFANDSDKKNTAIHEFIHLIDKADGKIDGIPALLLEKQYIIPWLDLMKYKIDEIYEGESDINPYGATNKSEFFAVISEYFFERPKLLKQKHPKLYSILEGIFDQDLAIKKKKRRMGEIGRNDPCPCGSGEKYKKCCGKV